MCTNGHTQALVSFTLIPGTAFELITEYRTSLIHNFCVRPAHTYVSTQCTLQLWLVESTIMQACMSYVPILPLAYLLHLNNQHQ